MPLLLRILVLGALLLGAVPAQATLRVITTIPDLADLAARVGGEAVDAQALVQGPQDPHFVQARPSFVRKLHEADVFVMVGMELEAGWAPTLLRSARNPEVMPGSAGFVDASRVIAPLQVPSAATDRGAGDVHPYGNPHYLTDPLAGLQVAYLLRERFSELDPVHAADFEARTRAFERELLTALVGADAVGRFEPQVLISAIEGGRTEALLGGPPGGWLGELGPYRGTPVVQDHRIFDYFTTRFGLRTVIELEPKPGMAPTTAHMAKVVETVRSLEIPLVLASPYFDPRHARRVAARTGAQVVTLAHQVGALEGAQDYLATVARNVERVREVLAP